MEEIYSSKELRKLAEKLVKASPEELHAENAKDIQTVIQELNLYRNQLQMQNKELQTALSDLRKEKVTYEKYFNSSPLGFLITNEHGTIQKVNEKTAELFECSPDDIVATNIYDHCTNENAKDELFEHLRQTLKSKTSQQMTLTFKRRHSSTFTVQLYLSQNTNEQGENQFYMTMTDVSSVEELKSQLQHSSKMEAIGNLAGGIAHDFNNMLSVIIGNTELAIEDTTHYSPVYENLQEIEKASQRAQGVVRQLLTFAQKSLVELEPLQLGDVVESSLNMFRPVIPTSIKINADLDKSQHYVLADATQIHQIFINLLTNSMDAMPSKVGEINVGLQDQVIENTVQVFGGSLEAGKYVTLHIQDSGHGIEPELLPQIFDPYFSTKDKIKNTGLGLSVVLGIVESLGGGIQIESDPQNGTTFHIYLPVTDKTPKKDAAQSKVPPGSGKILFIDDEITITKFGSRLIERMGYSVETVNDPIIAVEKFRDAPNEFDLVITDMTMPNMNGDVLVKEIKSIRKNLPVIICTGYHENMDSVKANKLGARYAMKPLNRDELAHLIHEAMNDN